MTLSKDYLKYKKRGYGQDHDFYDWGMAKDRKKLKFGRGVKVAVNLLIPVEFFPLNPSGKPFKHPGAMQTAYPDLRHFTVRDYGNRVGIYRILGALAAAGLRATFAVNGEIARRYSPLLDAIKAEGHEIAAHGLSTDHIHYEGLTTAEENKLIKDTLKCFDETPKGWMSPARTQSAKTLERLAKAGLEYCLDWESDQVPMKATTKNGDITLVPNSYELSDFTLLHTRRQTEESWQKQCTDALDYLRGEHKRFGAQVLTLTLTPYVIGQPFRIWALRGLLAQIKADKDLAVLTAGDIHSKYIEQTQ